MAISATSGAPLTPLLTESQIKRLDELEKDPRSEELKKKQQMNQEQFLFLITEQLKNQDPLSPMKDEQFIAQMAQLQSLESSQSLVKLTQQNTAALNSIKTNMESMNKNIADLVKAVSKTPDTPITDPKTQEIVNELIKMNQMMATYFK